MRVVLLALVLAGCAAPPDDVPRGDGIRGIALRADDSLATWRGGAALVALDTAIAWWSGAGALVQRLDWGYPVTLSSGDQPGYRMGQAGPGWGIELNADALATVGDAVLNDVLAHELGHVLGCGHILDDEAPVMYQYIHRAYGLTSRDIALLDPAAGRCVAANERGSIAAD